MSAGVERGRLRRSGLSSPSSTRRARPVWRRSPPRADTAAAVGAALGSALVFDRKGPPGMGVSEVKLCKIK